MTSSPTRFGVALPLEGDLPGLIESARLIESLGYESLWAHDDRLGWDPFVALAAFAEATERIQLGPGVTNPFSRHPGLITTACATLDSLSGGRTVIGLGAGGTNHRALGVQRRRAVTAMNETIGLIRDLLGGKVLAEAGEVIPGRDLELGFTPLRSRIPIHIGARGPKLLELAGAKADGVIVGNVTGESAWSYAMDRVRAGADRAGRTLEDVEVTAWLYTAIADDAEEAIEAVRPMAATSLVTSRSVLSQMGIEMPDDFAEAMSAEEWNLGVEVISGPARSLPVDLIKSFSLAGTPGECRAQLSRLLAAFPVIDRVVIAPFTPAGTELDETISRFMAEVAKPSERAVI